MMTTIDAQQAVATSHVVSARPVPEFPIPLLRIVSVELRKSVDTRAGFWLLISIGLVSMITTGAVLLFAPAEQLTFATFILALGYPIAVILPMVAVLSVTAEWSQRGGLTTFTLVPKRGKVLLAKALAAVVIALASMLVAFLVGAAGNLVSAAMTGDAAVWNQTPLDLLHLILGNTLLVLVGFMLGVLIRSSAGALVAYLLYAFVIPSLFTMLAVFQDWFRDWRPWVDPNFSQDALFEGSLTTEQWAHLAVTTVVWLVIPLAIGVRSLLHSEVK
jgi:ABC-2 type transport system permease protein